MIIKKTQFSRGKINLQEAESIFCLKKCIFLLYVILTATIAYSQLIEDKAHKKYEEIVVEKSIID